MLPWISIGAEQGHSPASVIHKQHPELHASQLTCRSFLYQFRPLFAQPEEEAVVLQFQKQIDTVLAKQPEKSTGRQLFLQEAMDAAKVLWERLSNDARIAIMQSHAERYFALSTNARGSYEFRAVTTKEMKINEYMERVLELQTKQDLASLRAWQRRKTQNPWRLSACTYDDAEQQVYQRMFDELTQRHAEELREKAMQPPPLPDVQERLSQASIKLLSEPAWDIPAWCKLMCHRRDEFRFCAVQHRGWVDGSDYPIDTWFLPLVSMQNPLELSVSNLDPEQSMLPLADDDLEFGDRVPTQWAYQFHTWSHTLCH